MSTTTQTIHRFLDETLGLYQAMEQMMGEKKLAIIAGDTQVLSRLDRELLGLFQQVRQIEKQRQAWLQENGWPAETSLREVVEALPENERAALMAKRSRLQAAIEQTNRINQNNQRLLDASLQWISKTVDAFAKLIAPEGAAYTANGNRKKSLPAASANPMGGYEHTPPASTMERRV